MCGICGFSGDGTLEDLDAMTTLLAHRGPDAKGSWHDPDVPIYLGHRRLSIIDIDGGSQPMWSKDGRLCVVFNGEIYNHRELRAELEKKGHRFETGHSDTEVLLYGYREWGTALPGRLNGMWAFAIYDRGRNRLFLSRDRFGKKPLFYALKNRTFVFASELHALARHPSIQTSISRKSLLKYFAYGFIPAPCSLYRGVYKLPGGHNMTVDLAGKGIAIEKYWEYVIEPFRRIPANPEACWGERIRELLRRAVKRRLMSDVPLGIFLSGGIDSSAIAAVAASIRGGDNVHTFSIGFPEKSFDESAQARFAAGHIGTRHHIKMLSMDHARGLLPEIAGRLDEPMGDASLLPTYLLSRETRKTVTVALGGDGGDELFAGYDPFHALRLAERYRSLVPNPVHHAIRLAVSFFPVSHRNISLDFKVKRTLKGLSYPMPFWNPVWLGPLEPAELRSVFSGRIDMEEVYSEAIECWDACAQENLLDRTLQFYTRLYLQEDILVKTDRAGMMNSLEVRAPFLDIDLVDFVRRIPSRYKYRYGQTKYILKRALEPVLPKRIVYRKKKGFGVPTGRWFQNGGLSVSVPDTRDNGKCAAMNPQTIRTLAADHRKGRADHRLFLWNYWLLRNGEWMRET